jgi:hypothetical protein
MCIWYMENVAIRRSSIVLSDAFPDTYKSEISERINDCDIIVVPEMYNGKPYFDIDVLDIVEELREKSLSFHIINPNAPVLEKRAADIAIVIGIVAKDYLLPILLGIVSRFIYDKIKSYKGKIPKAKVKFYRNEKEEYFEYDGPADKIADALRNFKGDEKDG